MKRADTRPKGGGTQDNQTQTTAAHDEALKAVQGGGATEQPGESGAAAAQPESVEQLQQQLADAKQEVLRAHAELDNFRKRKQREMDQELKYASLPLMRDLVSVLDNLQRAAEAARNDQASLESLRNGVEMVIQQFVSVLAKYGCHGIEAVGADFDPNVHEAISHIPSEEHEAGKVIQEVAPGYRLHERVVRPSNVVVSSGPPEDAQKGEAK
ncbi:MAG: nucleotide exchange factor GrpE [Planctomycetota bacterium]|nr:MAG: nucleotide exchange factor GrpE [Planctomycetota bacterium]